MYISIYVHVLILTLDVIQEHQDDTSSLTGLGAGGWFCVAPHSGIAHVLDGVRRLRSSRESYVPFCINRETPRAVLAAEPRGDSGIALTYSILA